MRTYTESGRTELVQSPQDIVAFPVFLGVVLLAVLVRQFAPPPASVPVVAVTGALLLLDVWFAVSLMRRGSAKLVVTPSDITVIRAGQDEATATETLHRDGDGTLSFRLQSNGFVGGQIVYALKLRENASGKEISVKTFGRRPVRRVCEAQGWRFT